jgi:hypothetical protein
MRIQTFTIAGLLIAAGGVWAESKAPVYQPVPGGFSSRLEALRASVEQGKEGLKHKLQDTLGQSRKEAHDLIDEIVDSEGLVDWLKAMEKKSQDGFAASLKGKDKELVRAALHGRLDRKLAKLGKGLSVKIAGQDENKLKASFDLAVDHLAREEGHIMEAAANARVETLGDSGEVEAAAPSDAPGAPRASLVIQNYYNYGQGGRRGYNAQVQNGFASRYDRTLQIASQRAWFSNQLAATRWNNQTNSFNRYLYGRSMPRYADPRFRRVGFPGGYYYRPDRVENVVRRGLWGAAAVAATPFALVASMF